MPAPKSKSATANGSAINKEAVGSGSATPNSTSGAKDDADTGATSAFRRPDKKAYDDEQESLKTEIDALQTKLNAVRDKIGRGSNSSGNDRRNELRAQLDELKGHQSVSKQSRNKIFEQMKIKQENMQKKIKDMQNAKTKHPFGSIAEVDNHIRNLEKQVQSGNMKLAEEKRALAEISTAKRSRRAVEGFQADQESIDADRRAIDELKRQLDDPEAKAISDKYETIKAELDNLRAEGNTAAAERNKLYKERDGIQTAFKDLLNRKRESRDQYKEANDRYYAAVHEQRAKRAEAQRLQKLEEEQQKKRELSERLLEEAEAPAFQGQIEDCQTLIDYFSGKSTGAVTLKSVATQDRAAIPGVAKLDTRKVEDMPAGSVVRKKKGEDEESYFVGKKGKGKKGAAKPDAAPPASASLHIPLPTLTALLGMSIPPPASSADVPRVVADLNTKKAWYEANQARVTADNVAKAQKEIQRLTGGNKPAAESAPAEAADEGAAPEEKVSPEEARIDA